MSRSSIRQVLGALVFVSIFSAVFSIGVTLVAKYRSEAFFATADMSLADLKQATPYLADTKRLRTFATTSEDYAEADLQGLADIFESPAKLRKVVDPVYPYSRADIRDVIGNAPVEGPQSLPSTTLLGLGVVYDSREARTAWASTRLAGDFVADALLRFDVLRTLNECLGGATRDARKSIADLGKLAAERRGIGVRAEQLRGLAGRKESAAIDARQVISLDKDTIQFLPLATQISGLESRLAELAEKEALLVQTLRSAEFRRTLCGRLEADSRELSSGAAVLKAVLAQTALSGTSADALEPTERQALQDVNYSLLAVETRRLRLSGYSLDARIPTRKNLPPLPVIVGASFLAGVLLWGALWLMRQRSATRSANARGLPEGEGFASE
ncbi:MAG: hypothetical protein LC121_05200 [Anaerolineae bacterium]|nr:hypothetical protein [Anaerolineae bacterium]